MIMLCLMVKTTFSPCDSRVNSRRAALSTRPERDVECPTSLVKDILANPPDKPIISKGRSKSSAPGS